MRITLISDTVVSDLVQPLTGVLAEVGVQPEFTVREGGLIDLSFDRAALYPNTPDLTILILHARELAPELFRARTLLAPVEERISRCEQVSAEVLRQVRALRDAGGGPVVVADFPAPVHSPLGIQDSAVELGLRACIRRINDQLEAGVRAIDGAGIFARSVTAARLGATHRDPPSAGLMLAWARELTRHITALRGDTRKVLVLDLDNTLWGGGAPDVVLGPDGPGRAFFDFQQACLDLHERGVTLALAGRGSRAAAMSVLRNHPHCLLREEHFAAIGISDDDKATACLKLAGQLRVGLNRMVLFEDNRVERGWVSQALPEVEVIPVPRDPARYVDALLSTPAFEAMTPSLPNPRVILLDRRAAA